MEVVSRQALRAPESFDAWLDAFGRAIDALPNGDLPPCPYCGHYDLQLEFVADPDTRVGFCAVWSEYCGHGIRVSRIAVPPGTPFLSSDTSPTVLADHIPAFIEIGPTGPVLQATPPAESDPRHRVVALLRSAGALTPEQIADGVQLAEPALTAKLQELVERGTLVRTGSGHRARYRLGNYRTATAAEPG